MTDNSELIKKLHPDRHLMCAISKCYELTNGIGTRFCKPHSKKWDRFWKYHVIECKKDIHVGDLLLQFSERMKSK